MMPALYDDTGPPLLIQGYASVFGVVSAGPDPMRLLPGACDHVGLPVFATFWHDPDQEFADARDGSLAVWTDAYGVAFEAAVPWSWNGVGIARGIRAGHFREVSCCWGTGRWSVFNEEPGHGQVETVRRAKLAEISIVPAAACPGTACWLDDEDPADLPPHVAELRARWHAGRLEADKRGRARAEARAAAARVMARVPRPDLAAVAAGKRRLPPATWAAIDAILAKGRPR
jgi:phage head maturation protease